MHHVCNCIQSNDGSFEYKVDLNFIDLNNDGINDISNLQNMDVMHMVYGG